MEASPPLADPARRPALRPKSPRLDGAEAEADPPGAGGGAPVLVSWTRWTRGSVSPGNPTICVRLCVDRFCEEELDIPHEWRAACSRKMKGCTVEFEGDLVMAEGQHLIFFLM